MAIYWTSAVKGFTHPRSANKWQKWKLSLKIWFPQNWYWYLWEWISSIHLSFRRPEVSRVINNGEFILIVLILAGREQKEVSGISFVIFLAFDWHNLLFNISMDIKGFQWFSPLFLLLVIMKWLSRISKSTRGEIWMILWSGNPSYECVTMSQFLPSYYFKLNLQDFLINRLLLWSLRQLKQ